jgi:alcohol dehydrogenase
MRGVCFKSLGVVEWMEIPDPEMESPHDAIVRVSLAGMCGSDLHPLFGREPGLDSCTAMGHEFVGTVVAVGPEVHTLQLGDQVYSPFSTSCGECFYCQRGLTSRCRFGQAIGWRSGGKGLHGAQAEFIRVPLADGTLMKIPKGLSAESALLLGDNLSTGYFCADMANIDPDGLTAIIGCGSVGLLSIQAAKALGAKRIVAIDPVAERRAMATRLGVMALEPGEQAIQWIESQTDGRGADSVMELVGRSDAQALAYRILRPGGTMSVIGCHSSPTFAFTPTNAYDKSITYRTGRCPARHYMNLLTDRVIREAWPVDAMITHRFQPSDCKRAYDIFANQRDGCIKGVFEFA